MSLHYPLPDLVTDTVRMDAALARLLNMPLADEARTAPCRAAHDAVWHWMEPEAPATGIEITEHALPEGVDFHQFVSLIGLKH